jgi:hypothetical protein
MPKAYVPLCPAHERRRRDATGQMSRSVRVRGLLGSLKTTCSLFAECLSRPDAGQEGRKTARAAWVAPELEERIRKALATPGRPGVRKIAERFGVDPGTVQRISRPRPFADGAASVVV